MNAVIGNRNALLWIATGPFLLAVHWLCTAQRTDSVIGDERQRIMGGRMRESKIVVL